MRYVFWVFLFLNNFLKRHNYRPFAFFLACSRIRYVLKDVARILFSIFWSASEIMSQWRHNNGFDVNCQIQSTICLCSKQNVIPKMSPSILLDEIEPWLPAAVAVGVILLSILILLCKQRRKSEKPANETKLLTGSPANAPSQAAAIEVGFNRKRTYFIS